MHLASFPCCSQQIPPVERAEGEGSLLCQDPCEGQRDSGCGWTTLGQRLWDHFSAQDKSGNLEMLCAGSCGTRVVPGQAHPRVLSMATQCPHVPPNTAASPFLPIGSKSSTWTSGMAQLSQHSP